MNIPSKPLSRCLKPLWSMFSCTGMSMVSIVLHFWVLSWNMLKILCIPKQPYNLTPVEILTNTKANHCNPLHAFVCLHSWTKVPYNRQTIPNRNHQSHLVNFWVSFFIFLFESHSMSSVDMGIFAHHLPSSTMTHFEDHPLLSSIII